MSECANQTAQNTTTCFQIADSIINKVEDCRYGFSCLRNEGPCMVCKPEYNIPEGGIFLEKPVQRPCPYNIWFGNAYICKCPVRKEIYIKYGC